MTVAIAQFLRIKTASGAVKSRWQNYFIGETVNNYAFGAFNLSALISTVSQGAESLTIEFPATKETIEMIETGILDLYTATIQQYQFVPPASGTGSSASRTLNASFTGEFQSAVISSTKIALVVGSNLDSTETQVPLRVFTTALAGTPPKL